MVSVSNAVDALFGPASLLVTSRSTDGRIERVMLERLLQRLGLHDVGVDTAPMGEGRDFAVCPLGVGVHDEIESERLHALVAEGDHLAKLPRGIDVQQRKGGLAG